MAEKGTSLHDEFQSLPTVDGQAIEIGVIREQDTGELFASVEISARINGRHKRIRIPLAEEVIGDMLHALTRIQEQVSAANAKLPEVKRKFTLETWNNLARFEQKSDPEVTPAAGIYAENIPQ